MILAKTKTMNEYQKDMNDTQTRINTLLNEKKELTTVNTSLANGFSDLEVFAFVVLGKE
jgi:hypothetical protein